MLTEADVCALPHVPTGDRAATVETSLLSSLLLLRFPTPELRVRWEADQGKAEMTIATRRHLLPHSR